MQNIITHLDFATKNASKARVVLPEDGKDDITTFVCIALDKAIRIISTIRMFLRDDEDFIAHEFSAGILSRSILMDMILTSEIKHFCRSNQKETKAGIVASVKKIAYKIINDGTSHLIEEIKFSKRTNVEKNEIIKRLTSFSHEAYAKKNDELKIKSEFKINLSQISKIITSDNDPINEDIVDLYRYYSKYDHLSRWTNLAQKIHLEKRLSRFETFSRLVVLYIRDLLAIAYDFGETNEKLLPLIAGLSHHLEEYYVHKDSSS